jgi:hypothetical protein
MSVHFGTMNLAQLNPATIATQRGRPEHIEAAQQLAVNVATAIVRRPEDLRAVQAAPGDLALQVRVNGDTTSFSVESKLKAAEMRADWRQPITVRSAQADAHQVERVASQIAHTAKSETAHRQHLENDSSRNLALLMTAIPNVSVAMK